LLVEIRAYLRSTSPSGKLTESFNIIPLDDGSEDGIVYTEEALRQAYVDFMENIKLFNLEPEDTPVTIEEFRIMWEESLVRDKDNISDFDPNEDDPDKPRKIH